MPCTYQGVSQCCEVEYNPDIPVGTPCSYFPYQGICYGYAAPTCSDAGRGDCSCHASSGDGSWWITCSYNGASQCCLAPAILPRTTDCARDLGYAGDCGPGIASAPICNNVADCSCYGPDWRYEDGWTWACNCGAPGDSGCCPHNGECQVLQPACQSGPDGPRTCELSGPRSLVSRFVRLSRRHVRVPFARSI